MVMDNFVCLQQRLWEQLRLDLLLSVCLSIIQGQILQQLTWTQESCWVAVDSLLYGELQLKTAINSILNDEEDL